MTVNWYWGDGTQPQAPEGAAIEGPAGIKRREPEPGQGQGQRPGPP